MKTKKQVMDLFFSIMKKLENKEHLYVTLSVNDSGKGGYWCVSLSLSKFDDKEIVDRENLEWLHFHDGVHSEVDDKRNLKKVEEFIEKINDKKWMRS